MLQIKIKSAKNTETEEEHDVHMGDLEEENDKMIQKIDTE